MNLRTVRYVIQCSVFVLMRLSWKPGYNLFIHLNKKFKSFLCFCQKYFETNLDISFKKSALNCVYSVMYSSYLWVPVLLCFAMYWTPGYHMWNFLSTENKCLSTWSGIRYRYLWKNPWNFFCIFFWRARVCWPLLCLCRPFIIFEVCLNSNS